MEALFVNSYHQSITRVYDNIWLLLILMEPRCNVSTEMTKS